MIIIIIFFLMIIFKVIILITLRILTSIWALRVGDCRAGFGAHLSGSWCNRGA